MGQGNGSEAPGQKAVHVTEHGASPNEPQLETLYTLGQGHKVDVWPHDGDNIRAVIGDKTYVIDVDGEAKRA